MTKGKYESLIMPREEDQINDKAFVRISMKQLNVYSIIERNGEMWFSELTKLLQRGMIRPEVRGYGNSQIKCIVENLEKRGLIDVKSL